VTLLSIALLAVVLTAPISELLVSIQNADDCDTVHLVLILDDSFEVHLYAGPGGWASWKFHVAPGAHRIGIDYLFNYTYHENEHDQIADFMWVVRAEFNGMDHARLVADEEGIHWHPGDFIYSGSSPLEQAMSNPYVVLPVVSLTVLNAALLVAAWNYCGTRLREKSPQQRS